MKVVFHLLVVVFVIVGAPMVLIWSLNTLFALSIPFALDTWVAAFFVLVVLSKRSGKE